MQDYKLKTVNGNNTLFSYIYAVLSNLTGLDNLPMKCKFIHRSQHTGQIWTYFVIAPE